MAFQIEEIKEILQKVDDRQTEQLAATKDLHRIKTEQSRREYQRLAAKYGAGHPRVKRLAQSLAFEEEVLPALEAVAELAKINPTAFPEDHWRVQGIVYDADSVPQEGLTVALYDRSGQYLRTLGYACTSAQGYFELDVSKAAIEQAGIGNQQPLFLTVTGADQQVICQHVDPVNIDIGKIDRRDIVLGGEQCQPPPERATNEETGPWIVKGTVTDSTGRKPLRNYTVRLSDANQQFTDQTKTDARGAFELVYSAEDLQQRLGGQRAIFVEVFNTAGTRKYRSDAPLRPVLGETEELGIKI